FHAETELADLLAEDAADLGIERLEPGHASIIPLFVLRPLRPLCPLCRNMMGAMATDYEKLGVFYLGREYDLAAGARRPDLVLYDSKDLVTHAVCVGMTGSGKTGLGIGLIEEAAIDGVPVLAIDPKG